MPACIFFLTQWYFREKKNLCSPPPYFFKRWVEGGRWWSELAFSEGLEPLSNSKLQHVPRLRTLALPRLALVDWVQRCNVVPGCFTLSSLDCCRGSRRVSPKEPEDSPRPSFKAILYSMSRVRKLWNTKWGFIVRTGIGSQAQTKEEIQSKIYGTESCRCWTWLWSEWTLVA